jgi:type IV pilus assembly protein PilA
MERTNMLKHLKERRQSEEGFTLIELMVVVLIMGILMAIAIPTFLATQGSAHDAAAKSNATNALTNEKAYFADNQAFSSSGSSLDSSLPWGTGPNNVQVYTNSGATSLLIAAESKSGNCYYIADTETGSNAYIGYAVTSGAASTGCALSSAPTLSGAPTSGAASANTIPTDATFATTPAWYSSW